MERIQELRERQGRWSYGQDGTLKLPVEDMDLIVQDYLRWRAWAAAIEASVDWAPEEH